MSAVAIEPSPFPVWKTITLGRYKTADEYRRAISAAQMNMTTHCSEVLNQVNCSQTEAEIDLVIICAEELGFTENKGRLDDIYAKAISLGLALCSAEVGPALRLAYPEQPTENWLIISTPSLSSSMYDGIYFTLGSMSRDGPWLDTFTTDLETTWEDERFFIFTKPRSVT